MRSREYSSRNSKVTYKKYDYELFRGIMSRELFDFAVACNEYVERRDRMEDAIESVTDLRAVG